MCNGSRGNALDRQGSDVAGVLLVVEILMIFVSAVSGGRAREPLAIEVDMSMVLAIYNEIRQLHMLIQRVW